MSSNKALTNELKEEIKNLTIFYLRYVEGDLGVPLVKIAASFAVSNNTVYSWASPDSNTTPSKGHFTRLHALSFSNADSLPIILATIKNAEETKISGTLYGLMVGAGLITAIGGLGPIAGLAIGAVAGPLGILVGAGVAALAGKKILSSQKKSPSELISPNLLDALKVDPNKSWNEIMIEIRNQNSHRSDFFETK